MTSEWAQEVPLSATTFLWNIGGLVADAIVAHDLGSLCLGTHSCVDTVCQSHPPPSLEPATSSGAPGPTPSVKTKIT